MGIRCETVLESDFAQTTLCACVRTCMHACPPHIHVHKTNTVCINNGIILKQCNNCKRKKKGFRKEHHCRYDENTCGMGLFKYPNV